MVEIVSYLEQSRVIDLCNQLTISIAYHETEYLFNIEAR